MRALYYWIAGALSLSLSKPSCGQGLSGSRPKKGEVRWLNTYFGLQPSRAWFEGKAPLTAELRAAAPRPLPDSLALVMLPDCCPQSTRKQHIRVYLLNPTAQAVPVERADATVPGIEVVLRLDNQWVLPTYPSGFSCGNGFWQDTLASNSSFAINLDGGNLYAGTIPVECMLVARIGQHVARSSIFTVQLTPLQLYFLRYPKVPLPDIY
ncbi:hypothetical protein [Hymenobacter sp. DG01]|uniref:hypothetical protein n=1 Tax=Hymenobacter sp. DG01 TaxID=2584940 RepID=UPI0011212114|nr:hypothetical protein [Hymenobacter sp. DG01]